MKIIREKTSKQVAFYFDDDEEIILSENSLSGKITSLSVNSKEFEVIENVSPFTLSTIYGAIKYDDGFYPVNQADYDAQKLADEQIQSKRAILRAISALEATITPRRTREAILGIGGTWLEEQEAAIAALRAEL